MADKMVSHGKIVNEAEMPLEKRIISYEFEGPASEYGGPKLLARIVTSNQNKVQKMILDFGSHRLKSEAAALRLLGGRWNVPRLLRYTTSPPFHMVSEVGDTYEVVHCGVRDGARPTCYEVLEMELVPGCCTLEDVWETMTEDQQEAAVAAVQQFLEQNIYTITSNQLSDAAGQGPRWYDLSWKDPFPVRGCLKKILFRYTQDEDILEWALPYFDQLERRSETVLTHPDLYPSNILLDSKTKELRTIIDWDAAGFFPSWWMQLNNGVCALHVFCLQLAEKMGNLDPVETDAARQVGQLFRALQVWSTPLLDPAMRAQHRKEGWDAVQSLVNMTISPPDCDYEQFDRNLYDGKGHLWWRD